MFYMKARHHTMSTFNHHIPNLMLHCVGKVSQHVVVNWISKMVYQVGKRTLLGHDCLCSVSEHGQHSKPSILNFLQFQFIHGSLGLSQVEHVEELTSWVCWVSTAIECSLHSQEVLLSLRSWVTEVLVSLKLGKLHQYNLDKEQGVWINPVFIIGTSWWDHSGTEPHSLISSLWNQSHGRQNLWCNASSGPKHGPTSMDDLRVGQPFWGNETSSSLWVRQSQRIESVVSWERSVQVRQ
mmetsp:Transcript_6732/g.13385  ORF Transcript_6732/g.13385 Transcript_6732/m.13385 type:complete len:238 (-) Transcript_6732:268-981(-)